MTELLDVFDANRQLIGTLERGAVHLQGLWHQTFHCWITGERAENRFVLLQLRSPLKKNYPDMLDITAAGHLAAGETALQGVRELQEELGVSADTSQLRALGIKHDIADEPQGIRNREFAHVFLLRDDRELGEYKLKADEVSGLVEVPLRAGLALFSGEVESIECRATRIEREVPQMFSRRVAVTDLIPRVDSYYLKIFIMANMMLNNEPYLCI